MNIQKLNNDLLSFYQMKKLKKLGIDITTASYYEYNTIKMFDKEFIDDDSKYQFSLSDTIRVIENIINTSLYNISIEYVSGMWVVSVYKYDNIVYNIQDNELINCLYLSIIYLNNK